MKYMPVILETLQNALQHVDESVESEFFSLVC